MIQNTQPENQLTNRTSNQLRWTTTTKMGNDKLLGRNSANRFFKYNDWSIESWIYDCLPQTQDLAKYFNAECGIRSDICPVSADQWNRQAVLF